MTNFTIPLVNVPQQFQISLAGKEYVMTCKWNDSIDAGWAVDFSDAITEEPIVANIPLVTGVDLLRGLEYLGFQGSLFILTDGNQFSVPTLDNLGIESNLYFQTDVLDG